MNISTKERIVTGLGLTTIAVIAAAIWWTNANVESASRRRQEAVEIGRALVDLRLITFDYRLYRNERSWVQWNAVSGRLDRIIAGAQLADPAQLEILAGLREKRAAGKRLFAELTKARSAEHGDLPQDDVSRRFEAQLLSQMLTYQQDSFNSAIRLNNLMTEQIAVAQQRMAIVVLAGLALIAMIITGTSWMLRRTVLAPIAGLQRATRQVAAGNWDIELRKQGADEIGDLSKNFEVMTKALRKSFAQIERSNQDLAGLNEELKAFSYSVAHDLRGPLRSLDGFSMMLLEDYGDKLDEDGKDALERIRAASQRMGYLIDDLLRLSRVTRAELNVARLDLTALAREIADSINLEHAGRSVAWEIETGLHISADPALMRIVMQNLLLNAWKFTGKTPKPVIRVGALERDAKTVYFIADNGAGFDMAHAEGLFGAFQRLHHVDDFPGTGIGLAIVQRIIRRHGGEIRAEAREGAGATFFFSVKEMENGSGEQDNPAG